MLPSPQSKYFSETNLSQALLIIYIYYTGLRFWYKDPSAVDKCGIMTYNDGYLSTNIIDDCESTISFMCEIDGQVKTGKLDSCVKQNS